MNSKEADLMTAIFFYISRAIAEGDMATLQRMGLQRADIELFNDVRLADLQQLSQQSPQRQFLDIRWHVGVFKQTLAHVQTLREEENTKWTLIKAGASREMMAQLYGMSNNEYAGCLLVLGLPYSGGRPRKLDERAGQQVWQAWQKLIGDKPMEEVTPEQYLSLHQATGVPLRAIWSLARTWWRCGELSQPSDLSCYSRKQANESNLNVG